MGAAPLPRRVAQRRGVRGFDPTMGVGDHQLYTAQPAGDQRAHETARYISWKWRVEALVKAGSAARADR